MGANHTFSHALEGKGQNKEVGSGVTIMGYAGITSYDVARHSIDIFHQTSISQIETNLLNKTCGTISTTVNSDPIISLNQISFNIPRSTPFVLSASASVSGVNTPTYCWEQNDNSTTSGSGSIASITKSTGPNWVSYKPSASPIRYFPTLRTILAGRDTTGPMTGGDAGVRIEALSSVSRTLNFRLTVRDNAIYSSVSPFSVGLTSFKDVIVTVIGTAGPFTVSSPNTNISWPASSNQTITWNVNGTNGGTINCSAVKISLSTDGGQTFPHVLASNTPNDGSEVVSLPNLPGSQCRIKVESIGNIFFDISNTNFTISAPPACSTPSGLSTANISVSGATLRWNQVSGATSYGIQYKLSTSSTWTSLSTNTNTINISGLRSNSTYNWQVRTVCSAGVGVYTASSFYTLAAPCASLYDNPTNNTYNNAPTSIPANTNITGAIHVGSDVDFYKFTMSSQSTITITLQVPVDLDMALVNSTGGTITSSINTGSTVSERISRSLTAGTYYVKVYPKTTKIFSASSCYTLRIDSGTTTLKAQVNKNSFGSSDLEMGKVNSQVIAYPNPVKNILNLNMTAEGNDVVLLNSTGSLVKKVKAFGSFTQLYVADLPPGLYLVKILKEGRPIQQVKIIKE